MENSQGDDSNPKDLSVGEKIETFLIQNKYQVLILLLGSIFIGLGILYLKGSKEDRNPNIEVLEAATESDNPSLEVIVEIAGAVEKPGVYKLQVGSRVEDLLIVSGGISANADRGWVDRMINRAAKLSDGQKIFIPKAGSFDNASDEHSSANNEGDIKIYQDNQGSGRADLVNINSASQKLLEGLPGIGPVYGQNIIEQRPYSSIEELVSKGTIPQHVFNKIKDKITAY